MSWAILAIGCDKDDGCSCRAVGHVSPCPRCRPASDQGLNTHVGKSFHTNDHARDSPISPTRRRKKRESVYVWIFYEKTFVCFVLSVVLFCSVRPLMLSYGVPCASRAFSSGALYVLSSFFLTTAVVRSGNIRVASVLTAPTLRVPAICVRYAPSPHTPCTRSTHSSKVIRTLTNFATAPCLPTSGAQSITAGCIFPAADATAQFFDPKRKEAGSEQWDTARTLRWLFFGFAVQAPWNHVSEAGRGGGDPVRRFHAKEIATRNHSRQPNFPAATFPNTNRFSSRALGPRANCWSGAPWDPGCRAVLFLACFLSPFRKARVSLLLRLSPAK